MGVYCLSVMHRINTRNLGLPFYLFIYLFISFVLVTFILLLPYLISFFHRFRPFFICFVPLEYIRFWFVVCCWWSETIQSFFRLLLHIFTRRRRRWRQSRNFQQNSSSLNSNEIYNSFFITFLPSIISLCIFVVIHVVHFSFFFSMFCGLLCVFTLCLGFYLFCISSFFSRVS